MRERRRENVITNKAPQAQMMKIHMNMARRERSSMSVEFPSEV